jgi:hypothetical protein
MKIIASVIAIVLMALVLPSAARAAERAKAMVDCKPSGEKLVYDCMIMLMGKMSGKPMDGAKIVVGADMPSMPMAHNVKPVHAMPTGNPGGYHARVRLEMEGEWALKMDVSGPTRDRIIHTMHVGSHEGMKHEHGEKKHDGKKHEAGEMKHGQGMKHEEK